MSGTVWNVHGYLCPCGYLIPDTTTMRVHSWRCQCGRLYAVAKWGVGGGTWEEIQAPPKDETQALATDQEAAS